ncbi:MAG: hypothetical protein ABJB97_07735 [Acidobacteriota bacterium]
MNDPLLGPDLSKQLQAQQRELGLLHGDRPTCPFLRPHILGRSQYEEIVAASETIASAFEKLVAHALVDDALMGTLGLTEAEEKMARLDPGYSCVSISSRLDAYLTETDFQFLEFNAENPAGISDQMQLEKILFTLPHMKAFLREHEHWSPKPHERLLASLLQVYREWGGAEELPQIAIVDWEGVSTASEFEVLKQYFESAGYQIAIIDPRAMEYDGKQISAKGFRIDILYKRVIIHEFLERCAPDHPLVRAYADGKVCMANSFRSKVAHKKAGFAILSDPDYANLFSTEEAAVIGRHIPWTRIVRPGAISFAGEERDLFEILKNERERLVLKPNDDYGGHGVVIGWETSPDAWDSAIANALAHTYVVQERVAVKKVSIPMLADGVQLEEMYVDFNPFLFHNKAEGGLVRLSASSLCNVSSGGGQTALLVLEHI